MIVHAVLLKVVQGREAELEALLADFCRDAPAMIPGVLSASCGRNFSAAGEGNTHGLVVTLDDRAALDGYVSHPRHVAVANALTPLRESRVILDYEA